MNDRLLGLMKEANSLLVGESRKAARIFPLTSGSAPGNTYEVGFFWRRDLVLILCMSLLHEIHKLSNNAAPMYLLMSRSYQSKGSAPRCAEGHGPSVNAKRVWGSAPALFVQDQPPPTILFCFVSFVDSFSSTLNTVFLVWFLRARVSCRERSLE